MLSIMFIYEDGYTHTIKERSQLKGIKHNNKRPIAYTVQVEEGVLPPIETANLNSWLLKLNSVLRKING